MHRAGVSWPEFKDKPVIGSWLRRVGLSNSWDAITPCMTSPVGFYNILAVLKGYSSVPVEEIRVRTAVTEHLPNLYPSEKILLWLKENSAVLLCTGSNTSALSLLVQGDRKWASRANSYIAEFLGSGALKPKVSWHSDCIPFPVCAQNNFGLFGAEVGQTFECRHKKSRLSLAVQQQL